MAGSWNLVVALALVTLGVEIECSTEVMKTITSGFMKALEECRHEQNFSDHVIRDLYFYWKEDYTLLNRETGCAIVCMSHKLNLLDTSGKLHHGKTKEFAMSHGAADDTAAKLVTSLHECENNNAEVEDTCMKALEVAKCFRTAIDQLNWTPKMDIIITEVLTDI
ncbi:general odorant-binding protein 1-like [Pectinophora gossypiella]|uniref:general odorant-binding protein 1-like n=1 Tax=Pectinophora gossypiella TaxID=13191 RepID=UPI00214EF865|nr:general odorant-binding protein 1-like [Pectinophora gossypiella]